MDARSQQGLFESNLEIICKNMGNKYGQKLLDSTKKLAPDALKTASKRVLQKTTEVPGDLVGNKTAKKIGKTASKSTREDPSKSTAPQIPQPTGIPKERYIPLEKGQQINRSNFSDLLVRFYIISYWLTKMFRLLIITLWSFISTARR